MMDVSAQHLLNNVNEHLELLDRTSPEVIEYTLNRLNDDDSFSDVSERFKMLITLMTICDAIAKGVAALQMPDEVQMGMIEALTSYIKGSTEMYQEQVKKIVFPANETKH